ncbi:MAG: ABC transporter ATP-binding protein [Oscillospiraceae bacterium]
MISLNNLSKIYNKKAAKPRGLLPTTLEIPSGSIVGLFGENGAGKTTMLRMMSGILSLGGGSVRIDEHLPIDMMADISYITGEGSYFQDLRVGEFGEYIADFNSNFDMARYVKLCDFFSLEYTDKIGKLSTGQRARVELAAGFARRCKYYFMDEPFLGKDIFTRRDFIKLMSGALCGDETIILSTHYVDEIESFIERVIILKDGKIAADTTVDELHSQGYTLIDKMAEVTGWDKDKYITLD